MSNIYLRGNESIDLMLKYRRTCQQASGDISVCFCPGLVACAIHQYRCASGQCVSEGLRCDGYADCSDHSDEVGCTRPPRCPAQLRCPRSHECLQREWLCDGEDDCKDGSDEKVKVGVRGSDADWSFLSQTREGNVCFFPARLEAVVCILVSFVSRTVRRHQRSAENTSGSVETAVSASLCPGGAMGRRTVTTAWTRTNVSMIILKY